NPLWRPDAPPQVVEHLLQAARGGPAEERSWFTGRTAEVDRVVGWVHARRPGVYIVTGSSGTGKSAIVGRVVSLSVPVERRRLLDEGCETWEHADPGENSVAAHAHARAVTVNRLAETLDAGLTRYGLLPGAESGPRNGNELLGAIERAAIEA